MKSKAAPWSAAAPPVNNSKLSQNRSSRSGLTPPDLMETTVAKIPFSELGLALGQQFLTREVIGGSGVAVLIGVGLGLWLTPVLQSPPAAAEPSELQINAPVTQPLEMADAVAPIQTVQQPELSPQLASVDSPAPARARSSMGALGPCTPSNALRGVG